MASAGGELDTESRHAGAQRVKHKRPRLQAPGRGLRATKPCWHLDLGLAGSLNRNWGNKLSLFKPPSLWHLAALAKPSCGPPRQGAVLLGLGRGLAKAGASCVNWGESIEIKFPEDGLPAVELHGERAGLGLSDLSFDSLRNSHCRSVVQLVCTRTAVPILKYQNTSYCW